MFARFDSASATIINKQNKHMKAPTTLAEAYARHTKLTEVHMICKRYGLDKTCDEITTALDYLAECIKEMEAAR